MAKKITELTELTTPASGDYLVVVDVSDTTDSPEGTTKKVSVENLGAGGGSVSSGSGAPNSTPTALGVIYIDTATDNAYIATGTSSSADWKLLASFS